MVWNMKCHPRVRGLEPFSLTDGLVWGDCGLFRIWSKAGGRESLGLSLRFLVRPCLLS